MECAGCKREVCGTCRNCKDIVKFGGPGQKKQKCVLRVQQSDSKRVSFSQQNDSKGKHKITTYSYILS